VFKEKVSGPKTDPPELAKLIRRLEQGDVLVVTRLDRPARSTRDLLNIVAELTERGAGFRSLRDAWADSTTPHSKLMLKVLGGLAEFERSLIVARTSDGRKRAKDRDIRFGRPRKLTPHQRQEAIQRLSAGETQMDIARCFNVHHTTIGACRHRAVSGTSRSPSEAPRLLFWAAIEASTLPPLNRMKSHRAEPAMCLGIITRAIRAPRPLSTLRARSSGSGAPLITKRHALTSSSVTVRRSTSPNIGLMRFHARHHASRVRGALLDR
jgi:hypothetical protein